MAYVRHIPSPPLAAFVSCFWYWEGAPETPAMERLMPTGQPGIIVNLCDDPLRLYDSGDLERSETFGLAMLSGARTRPFVIDNQQQDRVFGIEFRAGGAFPFFGMPAGEFENQGVPLDVLWGSAASGLRERLLEAHEPSDMFRVAQAVMLEQAVRPLGIGPAVHFALQSFCRVPHVDTVGAVTDRLGMSQRRFIEVFRDQVGVTPKAFCRVRRFQFVLHAIHRAREVNWAQVALDSGYYDQAHFIHDFRTFSSLTPSQYWTHRTEHLNHVPILR
jgi:AraC-like DNA-binding protein